ncbi:MAG: hypothetical protein Q4E88_03910 [Coriobacteriia bacterium]|nr:hypothetical protein [Coriobacteriia bacterium]
MTNRKTKFLPVFLIACLCLVASLGFVTFNAFASGNVNSADVTESIKIEKPEPITSTYSGKEMMGVAGGEGYSLSYSGEELEPRIDGNAYGKKAGKYGVKATLLPGYAWNDGSTDEYVFQFKIAHKDAIIVAEPASKKHGEPDPKLYAHFEGLVDGENPVEGTDYYVFRTGDEDVHGNDYVGAQTNYTELTSNYVWGHKDAEFVIHGIPVKRPQAEDISENYKEQIGVKANHGYRLEAAPLRFPYKNTTIDEYGNACGCEAGTYRLYVILDNDYEWADGKRIECFYMTFDIKPAINIYIDNTTFTHDVGPKPVPQGSTWHLIYSQSQNDLLVAVQVIYKGNIVASFIPDDCRMKPYYDLRPIKEGDVINKSSRLYLDD